MLGGSQACTLRLAADRLVRLRTRPHFISHLMTATTSGLAIDSATAMSQITAALRAQLASTLKRRGFVVGMSGGVDSAVCAALAVEAVGPQHVFGLFMPERESDPESLRIATSFAEQLGIQHA